MLIENRSFRVARSKWKYAKAVFCSMVSLRNVTVELSRLASIGVLYFSLRESPPT